MDDRPAFGIKPSPTKVRSLLAALGDPRRFAAPGKRVAFAGINPALRASAR